MTTSWIDDAETVESETDGPVPIKTLVIGTAMNRNLAHALEESGTDAASRIKVE
jgi:hypothetical protein